MTDALAPLITETARFTLGLAIAACALGLVIAVAMAFAGRHTGSPVVAARGLIWTLIGVLVLAIVLLVLLIYVLHRNS